MRVCQLDDDDARINVGNLNVNDFRDMAVTYGIRVLDTKWEQTKTKKILYAPYRGGHIEIWGDSETIDKISDANLDIHFFED